MTFVLPRINLNVRFFSEKHKTSKPGAHTEPSEILAYVENPKLCLVKHLKAYIEKTQEHRSQQIVNSSFPIQSHLDLSAEILSRGGSSLCSPRPVSTRESTPATPHAQPPAARWQSAPAFTQCSRRLAGSRRVLS